MGREAWTSRLTVEECPIHLSAAAFCSGGIFCLAAGSSFTVSWPLSDGLSLGKLRLEVGDEWRGHCLVIPRQEFASCGKLHMVDGQIIRLTTTRPHFGGERFWFVCGCGRRAGRLYLTGEMVFRCRVCCDLTYQSAQEHNTRWEKMRPWVEWFQRERDRCSKGRMA